jgi:hypothetical protein
MQIVNLLKEVKKNLYLKKYDTCIYTHIYIIIIGFIFWLNNCIYYFHGKYIMIPIFKISIINEKNII